MHSPIAYYICLDEEFDAPDIEADYELCQAIAAGRVGLHPDAWGSYDPLTTLPPRIRWQKPPPLTDRWWEAPPQWEGPPVVIPVLLGPEPPGTWTSPYPS